MLRKGKFYVGLQVLHIMPAILGVLSLTACQGKGLQDTTEVVDTVVHLDEIEAEESMTTERTTIQEQSEEESIEETEQTEQTGLYYGYSVISPKQQNLYREIYRALTDCEEYVEVSTLKTEELNYVFNCVMNDHPELFYVDGYQYKKYSVGDVVTKLYFYGNYTMRSAQIEQYKVRIEQRVSEILDILPDTTDEYEIAKAAYEYIINETQYDLEAENNQNICSVLFNKRSVCQGYAKTYQYLLQKKGIQAVLITGTANQDGHAWNLVKINGKYYYVDVTWGDASYILSDNQENTSVPPINYDYLLVTTEDICETHQIDELYVLPECTATEDNYYVREGLFLSYYDETKLATIFEKAYEANNNYVTIKCLDDLIYEDVREKLMDEQRVFEFIKGQGEQITYTENKQQRTISFWI